VGEGHTLAHYRCQDVAEVHAWLRASAGAPAQKARKVRSNG
jgi:hypothetical protein